MRRSGIGMMVALAALGVHVPAALPARRSDEEPDPGLYVPRPVPPRHANTQEVRIAPIAAPLVETRQMRRARERATTKARRR